MSYERTLRVHTLRSVQFVLLINVVNDEVYICLPCNICVFD
jgi:hypothetical protein